jgi:amino acid transporter
MSQGAPRTIGLTSMILLGINGIIGSGIFLLPGEVVALAGEWSSAVYLVVSALVLGIAWCFAQCASLFTRSGGAYIYAKEAFGNFIGFEIGLMRWAVGIFAWAAVVVGFVTALSSVWPEVMNEPHRSLVILSLVGLLGLLNIVGLKGLKFLNNVVTVAKVLSLMVFILIGLFYAQESFVLSPIQHSFESTAFGGAALLIFYAFGGFECLVIAAGEMKNPKRNLPIAVMTVISLCSILYFFIQFTAMALLGESLADSSAPLTDAANKFLGDSAKWVVAAAMLISIGGINIASSFITPRSGVALAEDGMVPKWIASKGRFGTPIWAIIITVSFTGLFALSGSFSQLAVVSVVARFVQYISTCLAVIVLRKQIGAEHNGLRRSLTIVIPIVALVGIGWLLTHATGNQLLWGSSALVLGIPLYFLRPQQR